METYLLTYRVTTPMFLGGVDQRAELRCQGIKGALRFWWRSLQAAKFGSKFAELLNAESELFGSSDQEIGKSKVRLRIVKSELPIVAKGKVLWELEDGLRRGNNFQGNTQRGGAFYLGYGAVNAFYSSKQNKLAGQLERECFMPGTLSIQVSLDRRLSSKQRDSICQSLRLLGTVGGLGSCNRRGYGSLTLVRAEKREAGKWIDVPSMAVHSPQAGLAELVTSNLLSQGEPEWSAWSDQSRVVVVSLKSQASQRDLLDKIGRELVHYRSWGNDNKVLGHDSEQNFAYDHHLFKNMVENGTNHLPDGFDQPQRVAFGLPHNYGPGRNVSPADKLNKKELDRRASPLFIHIHQFDDVPVGLVFSLPARFLPNAGNHKPNLRVFGVERPLKTDASFWNPIHGFLDRLVGKRDTSNPLSGTVKKTDLVCTEISLSTPVELAT